MHPFVTVFGIEMRSYPLMYALGAIASCAVCVLLARRKNLPALRSLLMCLCALASGIVGAAAAYCLVTYGVSGTIELIRSGRFETGLVFYGGLIGAAAFTPLIMHLLHLDIRAYSGIMITSLPLGHAIGRLGCYMAGCCGGIPVNGHVLPVQLIESACLVVIFGWLVYRCLLDKGVIFAYCLSYTPVRFLLEFLRGDDIRGFFLGLSTSQWISLFIIAATAALMLRGRHNINKEV